MALASRNERHLVTCEYPPQPGGVSDYSRLVAIGLAAEGETVNVWCPPSEGSQPNTSGVVVHRELGRMAPGDLYSVGQRLDQFPAPRRLLVQWVPHGYGYRSMNLPFCIWLWQRAKVKRDHVEIMVHEPFLAFGKTSMKQNLAAVVHRVMVIILLNAARRVWVSIPDWGTQLQAFAIGRNTAFGWLPVPSNIPVIDDADGVRKVRAQYAFPDGALVGHFGAYNQYLNELMMEILPSLLGGNDKLSVLLLGQGSLELRDQLIERFPHLDKAVRAAGVLSAEDISRHITACDVMLQPYEDGVSGRRTSVMTALSHGLPVVTTIGKATENCWVETGAVKLTTVGDIDSMVEATKRLVGNQETRSLMSNLGMELYRERFALQHVIAALRLPRAFGADGSLALSSQLVDN